MEKKRWNRITQNLSTIERFPVILVNFCYMNAQN